MRVSAMACTKESEVKARMMYSPAKRNIKEDKNAMPNKMNVPARAVRRTLNQSD